MSAEISESVWEKKDASSRAVGAIVLALAGFVVVALLVSWWLAGSWGGKSGTSLLGPAGEYTAGPAYRTSIEQDQAAVAASAQAHLAGYGWVDRRAGVVRIPIGRAMEVMAAAQSEKGGAP